MAAALARNALLVAGFVSALSLALATGEVLLRIAPPDDLRAVLGISVSEERGPYRADPVLGADYRDWDAFRSEYGGRIDDLAASRAGRPVWAMFGNSFVQAPGMLGDTASAALPDRQVYFLQRNEPMQIRIAQFRLLLDSGLVPERAFFVVLPVDLLGIADKPASGMGVTNAGAITEKLAMPPLLSPVLASSRLALTAWARSGMGKPFAGFRGRDVMRPLPAALVAELDRLFEEIARVSRIHAVPVSVVFIPNREQIMGNASRVAQQAFASTARDNGLHFIDTTATFAGESDPAGLLIADGHLSARGNRLLLDAILSHVRAMPGTGAPRK